VDLHLQPRRDELELAGLVLADPLLGAAAAGAGLLGLGEVMLDADVREVIQPGAPGGAGGPGSWRDHVVGRDGCGGLGLRGEHGEVEEMALVGVVDAALAAGAEDVAAEQGQGLGQLGVLLLEAVVIGGGRLEDALQLVDAAAGVLGLLPQRVVVAEQVVEEPLGLDRIVGEPRGDAHDMNYTR
jgi:hypothetical protein